MVFVLPSRSGWSHDGDASYPSTSPSFFPLAANARSSSTPTNVPFLPLTLPMNLTVPYMSPGTLTLSPTSSSSPPPAIALAALLPGVLGCPPVRACRLAFLFTAALALRPRPAGDFSAEPVLYDDRCSRCRGVCKDMMGVLANTRTGVGTVCETAQLKRVAMGSRRI